MPRVGTHPPGRLDQLGPFASRHVVPRNVDVWCPPGYADRPDERYPVVYMHDGQNLFDPALAYAGESWAIDAAMLDVMHRLRLPGALVVAVWNTPQRWREYMPQKPYTQLRDEVAKSLYLERAGGEPIADAYLQFLVTELKPYVDANYRSLPERAHTFLMGSSMGGLISLYAVNEHPAVYGGCACVSTHWPAGGNGLVDALGSRLPSPADHRLYFDFGTRTLDADYEPYQCRMDACLRRAGYTEGKNWMTGKFEGAEHSEVSWRARAQVPLAFLLG